MPRIAPALNPALIVLFLGAAPVGSQGTEGPANGTPNRDALYDQYFDLPSQVRGGSVRAHWMADGSTFWYAEGAPDATVVYRVDAHQDAYDYASNLPLAGNLQGRLLLISGTSDVNVPFSETLRMVEALTKAGKPYDLMVLPGRDHSLHGDAYWRTTIRRYLQEHLFPEAHP